MPSQINRYELRQVIAEKLGFEVRPDGTVQDSNFIDKTNDIESLIDWLEDNL